jgi:hypothetical protein
MTVATRLLIGGLAAAVVGLTIALAAVLISDRGGGGNNSDPYFEMMGAIGRMDSDDMLSMMRGVLGQDGHDAMVAHMSQHRAGNYAETSPAIGSMMHQMMDGILQRMPMNRGGTMPGMMGGYR